MNVKKIKIGLRFQNYTLETIICGLVVLPLKKINPNQKVI